MTTTEFRRLVALLRKILPVNSPVSVRRRKCSGCGRMYFNGVGYVINIDYKMEAQSQFDTLLHEWAHVVTVEEAFGHTQQWAANFSKVYREVNSALGLGAD